MRFPDGDLVWVGPAGCKGLEGAITSRAFTYPTYILAGTAMAAAFSCATFTGGVH
jgi:hypothetical protein